MSVALTIEQVRDRTKTVTRRAADTWVDLRPGDRLTLVEKVMGLRAGERHVVLAEVEIVSVRVEPLRKITRRECAAEGFPDMTPREFADMWIMAQSRPRPSTDARSAICRRIQWRYLDG